MRISHRIVLALTCVLALAQFAKAQVLEQVPPGAWVVIKVKNLTETNAKLSAFFKELGVDQLEPSLADPLAALKQRLGVEKGIDEKGEMAIVMLEPTEDQEVEPVVILIPVSDYKAFTGNFADAKTQGEVTEVQLPDETDPSYIAAWGKYAAVSPNKALLGKKPEGGIKLAGLTARELAGKDAIVYVNLIEIRKKAVPELQKVKADAIEEIAGNLEGDKAKYVGVAKVFVTQALGAVERYLQDANSATYGLSFGDTGITGTLMTEFEPGTYLGDNTKKITNAPGHMLTGIPNAKYLSYGGMVASPEVFGKVWDDFFAPIAKELDGLGADGKPIKAYLDAVRKAMAASKSGSFGMIAPSAMLGQESIIQTVQTVNGDAKAMGEAQKTLMETQQELMQLFSMGDAQMQTKVTITPAAKTIDGVALDQIVTEFSGEPNSPQAAQVQQMMQMMYGASGVNVMTGAIDGNTRVVATGVTDEVLQQLITAAKTKDETLAKSEPVAAVAGALPKEKVMVVYIAVDNLIATGLKYAAAFGMNMPMNLPPNQPPIGFSLATEGTAVRVDTFVPTQLVKSVTAAVIQLQMQMQGGGQGGGM